MSPVFINRECPECRGSGRIMMLRTSAPCPTCDGMGSIGEYRETRAEKAEAEVARLTKMVDWLTSKLSDHCLTDGGDCNITICPTYIACRNATPEVWKEAANRAVAGESK